MQTHPDFIDTRLSSSKLHVTVFTPTMRLLAAIASIVLIGCDGSEVTPAATMAPHRVELAPAAIAASTIPAKTAATPNIPTTPIERHQYLSRATEKQNGK